MKSVKPTVYLPDAFREKMTHHHINHLVFLQLYVNKINLFIFMCAMIEEDDQMRLNMIPTLMQKYLKKKGEQEKTIVFDCCCNCLDRLKSLVAHGHMSLNKKQRIANQVMLAWKQKLEPLIKYNRHIQVDDLGKLYISFDYFLVGVWFGNDISDDLTYFMEVASKEEQLKPV